MKALEHAIRILVVILLTENIRCQDGFSNQDLLRLHQIANEGVDSGYSANVNQRDPNTQAPENIHYQNQNEEFQRAERRARKVYRIKNPFQRQLEDERPQDTNAATIDSDAGTSNQYAAMQFSLPPEDFLQQMRVENQYYQQQQISTPAPGLGYTATPEPSYQYSTSASYYENNQQPNQIPQLEPKMSQGPNYQPNQNPYQYNTINSYNLENNQNTPSPLPPYLSTPNNNNQYIGTPANSYVSSSSPVFLSSQPNLQQYVSSPLAPDQTGSPDYNRVTTTIGSTSYDSNEANKKLQIDHYDNSANGVRYPVNPQPQQQQQFQTDYSVSTPSPSSPYPDPKYLQGNSISQYQRSPYENSVQDLRSDQSLESSNNDINRIGNYPSANNLYLNYVQPDLNVLNNLRTRTRDLQQDIGTPDYYSHGDYGWKMGDKKQQNNQDTYSSGSSYQNLRNQGLGLSDKPVSQMSFHIETGKQTNNYEQISKSASEAIEAQEFAKAAARAQERQQMYGNNYQQNYNSNSQYVSPSSSLYANERQKPKLFPESSHNNPFLYNNNQQSDLITASPYYYTNSKENTYDGKAKQPFDHAKALKNIVPIDVSNVVSNNDGQVKQTSGQDDNRYNVQSYNKDQIEQSIKQFYKPITDSYYKDKNTGYGYNIKSKPEEIAELDSSKQITQNIPYYSKQHEITYNQGYNDKRYVDNSQSVNYIAQSPNNYQDNVQSSANIQQGLQRPQTQLPTDISSILKFGDIPYRLTQGIPPESLRLNNNNFNQNGIPTPLPSRINQNVDSHQIDAANSILNKLMLSKQQGLYNRPEVDPQTGAYMSTINGFRVANPFNVDLKLVADMLKGKPAVDETHITALREQYSKPLPLKLDISQLQQLLLKNDNYGSVGALSDGLSGLGSPYFDFYGSGRFPYQGVKYSRSQEEEENIPIADASNNHPIGAVMEEDEGINGREVSTGSDLTADGEDHPKNTFRIGKRPGEGRPAHPNSLLPGRQTLQRQHQKSEIDEPYPLLKPPPPKKSMSRNSRSKPYSRRRRVNRPKTFRLLKTERLFEAGTNIDEETDDVPTLLRPPPPVAEDKSDVAVEENENTST